MGSGDVFVVGCFDFCGVCLGDVGNFVGLCCVVVV